MKRINDPYGVNVNELPIDWDALASDTSAKSVMRARAHSHRTVLRAALLTAAFVVAFGFFATRHNVSEVNYDYTAFYSVPGELKTYEVPASLRALSGYPDAYYQSAVAVNEYILGNN